jgi:hypothetical protein
LRKFEQCVGKEVIGLSLKGFGRHGEPKRRPAATAERVIWRRPVRRPPLARS